MRFSYENIKIIPTTLHCLLVHICTNWIAFVVFVGIFIMTFTQIKNSSGEPVEFVQYKNSCYYVSECGLVYSARTNKPKLLKGHRKDGYLKFALFIGNEKFVIGQHRLIAECWIPNPNNYPLVRHLNDIKSDVRVCNLAWGTKSDNAIDAVTNGKYINRGSPKGEKNCKAKLTEAQVLLIKEELKTGVPVPDIASKYGVQSANIYKIKNNKVWKHLS